MIGPWRENLDNWRKAHGRGGIELDLESRQGSREVKGKEDCGSKDECQSVRIVRSHSLGFVIAPCAKFG